MQSGSPGTPSVSPSRPADGQTSGSTAGGTPNSRHSSPSKRRAPMSNSSVRDALVTSVACVLPPVRRQMRKLSTVPNAISPASARARSPVTLSSSQRILVAEKYGSSTSPVCLRSAGSCPAAFSCAHSGAVRRSCQTIALATGRPSARSQSSVVSRWLVMPMAAIRRHVDASRSRRRWRPSPTPRSPPDRAPPRRDAGRSARTRGSRARARCAPSPSPARWSPWFPGRSPESGPARRAGSYHDRRDGLRPFGL